MYKELRDKIKQYRPSEADLKSIINSFLDHNFVHSGDNLFGEMYEAWVYEYLRAWAYYCPEVTGFVIKNPISVSKCRNGMNYDKNGQIVYISEGRKIAEYDSIFKYKDKIVFVESSVSELRSYYRNLRDRIVEKRKLLVELLKTEEVYSLVVTRPKKRSLVYRSLPHLILFTLKNPEFYQLEKTGRVNNLKSEKYISLNSIFSSSSS